MKNKISNGPVMSDVSEHVSTLSAVEREDIAVAIASSCGLKDCALSIVVWACRMTFCAMPEMLAIGWFTLSTKSSESATMQLPSVTAVPMPEIIAVAPTIPVIPEVMIPIEIPISATSQTKLGTAGLRECDGVSVRKRKREREREREREKEREKKREGAREGEGEREREREREREKEGERERERERGERERERARARAGEREREREGK